MIWAKFNRTERASAGRSVAVLLLTGFTFLASNLGIAAMVGKTDATYFPPPESQGGWRSLN